MSCSCLGHLFQKGLPSWDRICEGGQLCCHWWHNPCTYFQRTALRFKVGFQDLGWSKAGPVFSGSMWHLVSRTGKQSSGFHSVVPYCCINRNTSSNKQLKLFSKRLQSTGWWQQRLDKESLTHEVVSSKALLRLLCAVKSNNSQGHVKPKGVILAITCCLRTR